MNPSIRSQLIRASLTSVDDSKAQQLLVLAGVKGQTIGEAVRMQHFGLTSNPPAGALGLLSVIGGGLDRVHVGEIEHPQHRPTGLPSGGAKLYDLGGNYVLLDNDTVTIMHKASGNYAKIDASGNIIGRVASSAQQFYAGGDPAKGDVMSPIKTVAGTSPFAQARMS